MLRGRWWADLGAAPGRRAFRRQVSSGQVTGVARGRCSIPFGRVRLRPRGCSVRRRGGRSRSHMVKPSPMLTATALPSGRSAPVVRRTGLGDDRIAGRVRLATFVNRQDWFLDSTGQGTVGNERSWSIAPASAGECADRFEGCQVVLCDLAGDASATRGRRAGRLVRCPRMALPICSPVFVRRDDRDPTRGLE